jgi:hypothetical protein
MVFLACWPNDTRSTAAPFFDHHGRHHAPAGECAQLLARWVPATTTAWPAS